MSNLFELLKQPKYLIIGGIALIGGLYFATKIRPKSAAQSTDTAEPLQPAVIPYGVTPIDYGSGNNAPSGNPVTTPVPAPVTPQPPKPIGGVSPPAVGGSVPPREPPEPITGLPPTCGQGMRWNSVTKRCEKIPGTPRPNPTPPPPTPPPSTPNVPGGYALDCRGVLGLPNDYYSRKAENKDSALAKAITLEWAVMNIANSGHTGLYPFTEWISSPVIWPVINRNRRNRGLKALTEAQFHQLIFDLNTIIVEQRQTAHPSLPTYAQIRRIWDKWNTPFLCQG